MTFAMDGAAAEDDEPERRTNARSPAEHADADALGDWFGASDALALAFRDVLDAVARPAAPRRLRHGSPAIGPLSAAAATTLRVLADADALLWLAPSRATAEVDAFARFHLGAPPTRDASKAAFACGRWSELKSQPFARGTPERPDLSATVIVEVDGIDVVAGRDETASAAEVFGPGLARPVTLSVVGVDGDFWTAVAENAAGFPLGVDFILCVEDVLVGLPRSLRATPLGSDQEAR